MAAILVGKWLKGICARAKEAGYKVPRDFAVTGFDNLDKAAFFVRRLRLPAMTVSSWMII